MLLLVDLDGVVYRGSTPVPGIAALLAERVAGGDDVVYVTNNSMHPRDAYLPRLTALGAPVSLDRVVTSARATALFLVDHLEGVRSALVVGAAGLEREVREVGIDIVTIADATARAEADGTDGYAAAGRPDAVVVGLDRGVTYRRISVAADAIRAGARFVATNRDPVYPTERGLTPGAGSIVAAIEVASGTTPVAIGKPEPHLLEEAARVVGRRASEAVMIGDGLVTDLPAAHAAGARCVLMLTGVTSREQLDSLASHERPTAVAADSAELRAVLDRLREGLYD